MNRLLVSAAHKSSGKTLVSLGLCAALTARDLSVQPFKKGPDYIDPMWLGQASGKACYNLDPYLMTQEQIERLFIEHAACADLSLVEGNKGLYDGLALDGSNSSAALAKMLGLPVVLVLDARGMTRGVAPLLLGYQAFDPGVRIAGVILNRVGGSRHESKLRAVIEHYTSVQVIGAIAEDRELSICERHLGLMPSNEHADADRQTRLIGDRIAEQVDLDKILSIAAAAAPWSASSNTHPPVSAASVTNRVRIGIALDQAFGFYYPDDLQALEQAGAELVPFDTLKDRVLPQVDGLFIGGGFPELFMEALQANVPLRQQIGAAIEAGMPTYAECGGLMYLARSLTWKGRTCQMVGAIPGDVTLHEKPVGRGYVHLSATDDTPWAGWPVAGVRGHEFHYSSLDNLPGDTRYAWKVERGHGINGSQDGIVHRNLLASYTHLRQLGTSHWASLFINFVAGKKQVAREPAPSTGASLGDHRFALQSGVLA